MVDYSAKAQTTVTAVTAVTAVSDLLKGLSMVSKKDDIPGTVDVQLDELCPACRSFKLKLYKPCCGSPKGYKGCKCGYKVAM
jgi:hypothetical protein